MEIDRYESELGGLKMISVLLTDWGTVRLPDSASTAYQNAPKNRLGRPDRRFTIGKRLDAYEWRQIRMASEALGDFTPEEFA